MTDKFNENETKKFLNKFDEIKEMFNKSRDKSPEEDLSLFPEKEEGASENTMSKRKRRTKKAKRYKINFVRLGIAFLVLCFVVLGAVGLWVNSIIKDTPKVDADNIYTLLAENSVLYDDQGEELENLFYSGQGLRTNLSYTELPENLVNAFIAIEDKTFWDHKGFNFVRIVGAVVDSVRSGGSIKGTSTISQQLARNLYLPDTKEIRTMTRKIQEAYYARVLEKQLSKEQIIEAYLNTIYLGSNSNGVQAAAKTYFSKDVDQLTLAECAVIASIPKYPLQNSPMKRLNNEDISDPDSLDFIYRGETYSLFYQDLFQPRQLLTLALMKEQEMISEDEYQLAINENIRDAMNPDMSGEQEITSYFADYVINEVVKDLMAEFDIDESRAKDMIYNGGLRIHSTLNVAMQKIIEDEYENDNNFPKVVGLNKNKAGDARDASGKVLLYLYDNMIDQEENFTLKPNEYEIKDDGTMVVFKNNRLNIYKTEVNKKVDYSVEFKPMYVVEDGKFYTISAGFISIPTQYKSRDEDGNLILHKDFFGDDFPFKLTDEGMVISKGYYQLKEKVMQPQSAMVILDYKTGEIKAMAGGRGLSGKQLFNRATSTRQPGSAIKPIGVYGPALQRSADMGRGDSAEGGPTVWTAASVIDDAPLVFNGKLWPKNWYTGYRGLHTLRQSVEQSINVNAVKVQNDIGPETSLAFMKKLGVTSVVESGYINDMNPAAMALGGMTNGISPLQMTAAYGAFANEGFYVKPAAYTLVTNKRGDPLLEKEVHKEKAMDSSVAFIMNDILRTTVTSGIAGSASIGSHVVAGKTGTTTDNYDAWFVGMTPHYGAALWIGNDINLELSQGSVSAARLWSKIMKQVHKDLPKASFPKGEGVVSATIDIKSGKLPSELSELDPRGTVRSEYFSRGTVPTEIDDIHVWASVCGDTGYLATPYCSNAVEKIMTQRPEGWVYTYKNVTVGDIEYEVPLYFCHHHNPDITLYPIDPDKSLHPFVPPEEDPDNGDSPDPDGGENGDNGNNNGNGGNGNGNGGNGNGNGNGDE